MRFYNFARLVQKYSSEFKTITLTDGYIDDLGDFVKGGKVEKTVEGAVISFKESKIYRAEGTLSANDRQLFTLEPIGKPLDGVKAIFENKVYSIEDCTENAKFTGIWTYTLKYVSAFKGDSE